MILKMMHTTVDNNIIIDALLEGMVLYFDDTISKLRD